MLPAVFLAQRAIRGQAAQQRRGAADRGEYRGQELLEQLQREIDCTTQAEAKQQR
jgi:hypothetical protein